MAEMCKHMLMNAVEIWSVVKPDKYIIILLGILASLYSFNLQSPYKKLIRNMNCALHYPLSSTLFFTTMLKQSHLKVQIIIHEG
jgi:hypothetical protein